MAIKLPFGFELKRSQQETEQNQQPNIVPPTKDDGAIEVESVSSGEFQNTYLDLNSSLTLNEADLITRYRQMALQADLDQAIRHIINEAVVQDEEQDVVQVVFRDGDFIQPKIKSLIEEEFKVLLDLLEFNNKPYEIFRTWYVDGRINYEILINNNDPSLGIRELRFLDPRKIRKIRELERVRDNKSGTVLVKVKDEYFIYNEKTFSINTNQQVIPSTMETKGIKISKDMIASVTSGITDEYGKLVLSYLHPAIKPLNNLKQLEDAVIIYRLVRAPERRVFYIDVGDLPKVKAEQHLRDVMTRHKNKLVYDTSTGMVRDQRNHITMLEDFWFSRRNGEKGTEVTTLPPGQNIDQIGDVEYFQKKLYASLNVPLGRLNPDSLNAFGVATEISREEVNFSRFVDRLRIRFSDLFLQLLQKQLILKNIINADEWVELKKHISFKFARDTFYAELKNQEILKARMETVNSIMPVVGRYYSNKYVRLNILNQTEEDIEEQDQLIAEEMNNPQYMQLMDGGEGGPPMNAMGGAVMSTDIPSPRSTDKAK